MELSILIDVYVNQFFIKAYCDVKENLRYQAAKHALQAKQNAI